MHAGELEQCSQLDRIVVMAMLVFTLYGGVRLVMH